MRERGSGVVDTDILKTKKRSFTYDFLVLTCNAGTEMKYCFNNRFNLNEWKYAYNKFLSYGRT